MYEPAAFRVEARAELLEAIRAWPLGLLVTSCDQGPGDPGPGADLVPFVVSADGERLQAHVARANPLGARLVAPEKVLVVFLGPQAYVSPSHYPSKQRDGRVVPTWNYAMIQVEGVARLRAEPEWIAAQLDALTAQQEKHRPAPWARGDAPEDFIAARLKAIVGVEIEIGGLVGKYKLSQNRSAEDRQGVIAGLSGEADAGAQAVAALMRGREAGKNIG